MIKKCWVSEKISFGGIPNSRNVLFLQIFLERAGKPSAGNTSAGFPWVKWTWPGLASATFSEPVGPDLALHQGFLEPCTKASHSPEPSLGPCWPWPGSAPKPPILREPSPEPCWTWPGSAHLCAKTSRNLLRNLLQNPVEPNLALHQSLPHLLRNLLRPSLEPSSEPCWTWLGSAPKPPFSGTFSGTFFGTLLNLTWLCTKASQIFSGTFGTFSGTSLNLTRRLHQCTPELFWAEDPISLLSLLGKKQNKTCTSCANVIYPDNSLGSMVDVWCFVLRSSAWPAKSRHETSECPVSRWSGISEVRTPGRRNQSRTRSTSKECLNSQETWPKILNGTHFAKFQRSWMCDVQICHGVASLCVKLLTRDRPQGQSWEESDSRVFTILSDTFTCCKGCRVRFPSTCALKWIIDSPCPRCACWLAKICWEVLKHQCRPARCSVCRIMN